jgi:aryl-alcohol dehydrogenase-like predicted oxidoreductase
MQYRQLGALSVSKVGLGCMGLSEFYGPADHAENKRVISAALDLGVTLFDTADIYGLGDNERLVGAALAPVRQSVVIASKFGILRDANDPAVRGVCGRPDYVRASCEASLKRLGTDYIDLFYMHRLDADVPIEETVGAMADLVAAGKVRHIGLSEVGAATIARAHAIHPIAAVQSEYSLISREQTGNGVMAQCESLGIGFVPYSPLCRGLLSERFDFDALADDDFRRQMPRFKGDALRANLAAIASLHELAHSCGVKTTELALAWVMAQGDHIVPIPGTKRLNYLQSNVLAATLELSSDTMAQMDRLMPEGSAFGARYPEAFVTEYNLGG